jgi:hypothetical protein
MAQYLQWNAPATTVQFGTSRLVDESCTPFAWHGTIPAQGLAIGALAQVAMPERRFDVLVINKTGWQHHTPPTRQAMLDMDAQGVEAALYVGKEYIGAVKPGGHSSVPCAAPGLVIVQGGDISSQVSVYVFPY